MTSIRKTAVRIAGRALLVLAQLMAIVAGVVQPALPTSIASLQPLVGAPQVAFAAGEVVRVTKVVTTTDGSALPSISGNFTLAVNCVGASGFPTTTQVAAGGATNYTTVTSGTQCLAGEDTFNLPTPPAGYTWAGWMASAPVTATSNATGTLTVTNFLAPTFATATSLLTVTKTVSGAAQPGRVYTMTVTGPNSYNNTFTLTETGQLTRVLTGLTPGIYTVTEQSPGAGWGTSYAVANGSGITSSSNAVMTLSGVITATPFTVTSITGTVYADFNADGMMTANGALTDTGVASVTVTAYPLNGATLGPVQTDASGRYTITTSGTQGPFRMEFTKLPPDYEPSRVFIAPSSGSGQNGTSVQFINTVAQAAGANFAIVVPCETCVSSNPLFAATRSVQVSASPTAGELAISSVRDFPYTAGTTNPAGDANTDSPTAFTLYAATSATGNIGAMSYDNANRRMFLASYFKRHTIFGPGGSNAIYVLNTANNTIVQTITMPGPATNWHDTANYNLDYRASGSTGLTNTFDATGKSSLGGMELALDGQHLFVINLENRTLYKIHVATGVAVNNVATPLTDCSNNDARPYALKFYRGKLYLGVTCTAETSQLTTDLKALVYTVDPNSLVISPSPVFSANLNYTRGFASYTNANGAVPAKFNPWTNVFRRANAVVPGSTDEYWVSYPQPYVTDIDFDNGNLILALRDRYSDQTGNNRPKPDNSATISAIAAGDLLRACGNPLAGWTTESNRTCGGVTAASTTPVSPTQGLGGIEYYADGFSVNRSDPDHDENATGSIFQLPGSPLLMAVVYDPIPVGGLSNTFDGGVAWFDNRTGGWVRGFRTVDGINGGDSFGKSSGMGDTSALCNPPPLEIGNRVWDDVNGNGVQDPGEPGLSAVMVTLAWAGGLISTTSDINGNYYFTREAATGTFSQTLAQYKAYTITFSVPAGYSLTVPNAQAISGSPSSNDAISDTRDSDAVPIANVPTILYTTGAYGENNHGLDAGFTRPTAGRVNVTNTPPMLPQIKLVKYTNGFDADAGTGPFIGVGRPVTWTYVFTNTGAVTLTNLAVNDTPAGAVTICSPSLAGLQLAPGGRVTCVLTSVAVAGVYSNTAVVTGTSSLTGQPVSDTNPSRYFGAQPAIVLRKYTNGFDADTLTDSRPVLAPNAPVLWAYVITNTGNMTLVVALTDDRVSTAGATCAPVALGGQLAVGGVTTCTLPGTALVAQTVAGIYTNTAVVTGTPQLPPGIPNTPDIPFTPTLPVTNPVTSTNPSHYEIYPQFGDRVWLESDGDGDVNTGFLSAIAGMTITATNGVVTFTTTTGSDGYYSFTLPAGAYMVIYGAVPPAYGAVLTSATPAGNSASGNAGAYQGGGDQSRPQNSSVTLTAGEANWTMDFAFWRPAALGDYVWVDANRNGIQDEPPSDGFNGLTVTLYVDGMPISTTITASKNGSPGYYLFDVLNPGTYTVCFAQPPAGYAITQPNQGSDDGLDSDADMTTGCAPAVTLVAGERNLTIDMGIVPLSEVAGLGDFVWIDSDGNGLQDTGEMGVPGVTVTLRDATNTVIDTRITNASGYYSFTDLTPATYAVCFTAPRGYTLTLPNVGGNDAIDSDADMLTGCTPQVTLATGEYDPTLDAGLVALLVNLGNQVWFDTNDNGLRDASEVGIAGVRVELYRDSDNNGVYTPGVDAYVDARVTDAGGNYTFTDLTEGRYVVVVAGANFSAGNVLAGYRSSTTTELDANANVDDNDNGIEYGVPSTGSPPSEGGSGLPAYVASSAIDLKAGAEPSQRILPGDSNWTVDFGFFRLWLGGTIWLDVNYDGLLNDGAFAPGNPFVPAGARALEPGIPNIPVELLDPQGNVLAGTTTDAGGVFTFTGLLQGSYAVRITAPDGKRSTMDVSTTADPNNDVDQDDNGIGMNFITISSGLMTIVPGAEPVVDNNTATSGNPTFDFGLVTGPLLIIRKTNSTDGYVRPNDFITYTLTVTNIGVTLARNVIVTDNVPANTTFVSASGSPAVPIQNGPPVVWQVGDMPPGSVFAGTFVVRVFSQNLNSNLIVNAGMLLYDNSPTETVSVPTNEVLNPLAPTAVTLASFSALVDAGGVKVTWQTALERNTFAYNVLRSATGRREDAVQVNANPLPAVSPSTYSFVDAQGSAGNTYWIEEIDLDGARNTYGPTTAQAVLPAVSQPVVAPPAVQVPAMDTASVAGVVGGGVPMAIQNEESSARSQAPAPQAAQAVPAAPAVIAPDAQPAVQPEPAAAQPVAQREAQQPAQSPPAAQEQAPVQQPAPQQLAQPALPLAKPVVVGAESGVNVARGGGQMQPKRPQVTAVITPAETALLPMAAGALALFGIGGAGAFVIRRRRKTS